MPDNYKNIDDLFRDKFKDFEPTPPDQIWNNIRSNIPQDSNPGKGSNLLKNGGIAGITIVLLIASLLSIYQFTTISPIEKTYAGVNQSNEYATSASDLVAQNNQDTHQQEFLSISVNPITDKNIKTVNTFANKQSTPKQTNYQAISFTTKPNKRVEQPAILALPTKKISNSSLAVIDRKQETINNKQHYSSYLSEMNSSVKLKKEKNISPEDDIIGSVGTKYMQPSESLPLEPGIKSDYGQKGNWLFGVFFTPEVIFYPSDDNYTNRKYALDFNGYYQVSNYFIQSGLGLAWSSDEGNYMVGYNEYLGTYQDVYDITFDTTGNEVIPTYHTESVDVYDSITHLTYTPTKNKYTYLQIPVLFGYGNDYKRFGWFTKSGLSVSILINEKIPSVNTQSENNKVLDVENDIPNRINIHWQFVISGGVTYKLSNNLKFVAEPMFRLYINSAYIDTDVLTKHPYSFGLRTGLLLNF